MKILEEIWEFVKPFIPFLGGYEALTNPPKGTKVEDYATCSADCSGSYEEDRAEELRCKKCCNGIAMDAVKWLAAQMGINFVIGGLAFGIAIGKILESLAKKLLGGAVPVVGWIFVIGELANIIALAVVAYWLYNAHDQAINRYCNCSSNSEEE